MPELGSTKPTGAPITASSKVSDQAELDEIATLLAECEKVGVSTAPAVMPTPAEPAPPIE